jgi:hypothetical protein
MSDINIKKSDVKAIERCYVDKEPRGIIVETANKISVLILKDEDTRNSVFSSLNPLDPEDVLVTISMKDGAIVKLGDNLTVDGMQIDRDY